MTDYSVILRLNGSNSQGITKNEIVKQISEMLEDVGKLSNEEREKEQLRDALLARMKTLAGSGMKRKEEKREFVFMGKMYRKHVIKFNHK